VLNFTVEDVPAQPTDLAATVLNPETLTVDLTWNDVAVNETGYVVETFVDGAWVAATEETLAADATKWTTGQLELGTTYAYRVAAVNDYGQSDWATLEFTTENVPNAPTGLKATVDAAFNATLTWTDAATTETGYEVAIIDEKGECQVVATLKADATEWTTDAPLAHAATYAYAVRAVNEYGFSTWIAVEFATLEAASTVVTTAKDVVDAYDGKISLREAIQYAEAGATIAFADDVETITLAGTQLEITKAITIDGGENGVTVDADGKSRVFNVDAADGTVALQNLTVTDGYTNSNGGGVYVADGAASFTNVTIAGNTAGTNGGGVHVDYAATATFTNVTISGNTADNGGGGVNLFGTATFTNVAIVDNTARFYGGGVYVYDVEATFTNATISGNQSESGGSGAYVHEGTLNFYNSILVGNAYDVSVTTYDGTANADRTLSNFFYWANANEEGVTNYVYDATQPLFADGSYTLAAGSQAINKGNAAYLADEITTDLAGNPRFNCAVDLGAYESQALLTPTNLTVSKLDPETRQVTFTWDDVDLETEYLVMLWSSNGDFQTVLAADATSWTPDFEFALGATGFISITPTNNAGVGAPALLTFTLEDVPAQPTDLSATVDAAFNAT
ncbi:MAG: hypothetical protein IIY07_01700, partial [Thermoguttaceae bacterium]|nr:hypothetical protein [Thermoguttaceae bacterium]